LALAAVADRSPAALQRILSRLRGGTRIAGIVGGLLVAAIGILDASDVRDALALAYERRFPGNQAPKTKIGWLTDNGGIFIAKETQLFAEGLRFIPCQRPAYSPESNGCLRPS